MNQVISKVIDFIEAAKLVELRAQYIVVEVGYN